jgi:Na+/melibiose symporter-like transporter
MSETPAVVAVAAAAGVVAVVWFIRIEQHALDPLVPLAVFRRRQFVGANVVWLLAAMTSWGAVFFLAVHLQVTLGLRPIVAGLLLTPIYLVMMAGSPLAAALARRFGRRQLVLTGLAVYAMGLWLLSTVDAASTVPWGVLAPLAVFAVGMAAFTAAYPRALAGAAVLAAFAIPVTLMALPRTGAEWAGSPGGSQPMRLHGGAP